MSTQIYYFTGTGNSLKIAKDLARELGDSELISIPQNMHQDEIICSSSRLGIVFPVYMLGIPLIVVDFIKKLNISNDTYVFFVANHGHIPGPGGTLLQSKRIMEELKINLNAVSIIKMVNNYVTMFGLLEDKKIKRILKDQEQKVRFFSETIKKGQNSFPSWTINNIFQPLWVFLNNKFRNMALTEDKHFRVDDKCNSCGICEKICPVNNIQMKEGKPEWLHKCQQCICCFHLCPKQAIQLGKKSTKCGRYVNPEVSFDEIFSSNTQKNKGGNYGY